jgi:hypothetical protein
MRIFWGIWNGDQTIEGVLDRNTGSAGVAPGRPRRVHISGAFCRLAVALIEAYAY